MLVPEGSGLSPHVILSRVTVVLYICCGEGQVTGVGSSLWRTKEMCAQIRVADHFVPAGSIFSHLACRLLFMC